MSEEMENQTALAASTVLEAASALDRHTVAGTLWRKEGERIRCVACGHRCLLSEGRRGVCKVRYNRRGELRVPFGYVAGVQCDPIEKKPFFHAYPGSDALTFGMLGCDFHCGYCQNWLTSQALRDSQASTRMQAVTAKALVDAAVHQGARFLVSSYNEPLITAEWAVSVFELAQTVGLECAFVSNGNATPEALDYVRPWIVAYKIDLKTFNDRQYRALGGTLANVLETVRMVKERGLWLEVVTLLVPGFNDSPSELREIARFLASVDRAIPWHVTAFHPDYRMQDPPPAAAKDLVRAAEIGAEEGLQFIYAGNLPGHVGAWEDTRCPGCGATLVKRSGYLVGAYEIGADGHCPHCARAIPGLWPVRGAAEVRTSEGAHFYQQRRPRRVTLNSLVL